MKKLHLLIAVACVGLLAGCYHATIETGLPASPEVYHQTFASAWVYGLVPPKTVEATSKCAHGVAKVETQLSFVNQLVGALTFGIYTPMEIKVTCASQAEAMLPSQKPDLTVKQDASTEEVRQAFMSAADLAVILHRPVFISY